VEMFSIHRGADHFDLIALEFFDDGLDHERAKVLSCPPKMSPQVSIVSRP
jgi:hypothetical protein